MLLIIHGLFDIITLQILDLAAMFRADASVCSRGKSHPNSFIMFTLYVSNISGASLLLKAKAPRPWPRARVAQQVLRGGQPGALGNSISDGDF